MTTLFVAFHTRTVRIFVCVRAPYPARPQVRGLADLADMIANTKRIRNDPNLYKPFKRDVAAQFRSRRLAVCDGDC